MGVGGLAVREGYKCIVVDPPWPERMSNKYNKTRNRRPASLPYKTMSIDSIKRLPVGDLAGEDAHLWLWTTNSHLRAAFDVIESWGFKYLTTITWVKPSGLGNYFVSTTQHCLFAYKGKCRFPLRRYAPTNFSAVPRKHSEKPEAFFELCESVSPTPRVELFARKHRLGWDVWGDEVDSAIHLNLNATDQLHPDCSDSDSGLHHMDAMPEPLAEQN